MGLDVRLLVERPDGQGWLSLADGETYRLHGSSFADTRTQMRRQEVSSIYVEGSFLANAVRENVEETVSVYVHGNDHAELERGIVDVTDAFTQLAFRVYVEIDGLCCVWSCFAASDVQVQAERELRHARMAVVTVHVPRLPQVRYVRDVSEVV